jgi:hypothetical protein
MGQRAVGQTVVPTRYDGDRFFASPITTGGDTLLLLIDTGGGGVWMIKPVLQRLGLKPRFVAVVNHDSAFTGGKFPSFQPSAALPIPLGVPDTTITGYGTARTKKALSGGEGILGHTWMADRVWVFDYPAHRLAFYEDPPESLAIGRHTIPMSLKRSANRHDPRIEVLIDGDSVNALLDTGGTSDLSPAAIAVVGRGPSLRASSFAAAHLWDKWHARHPTWRVVRHGEESTGSDLIEVPLINIAGYRVGPVWFTKRPDKAYSGMMSMMTDRPILAAIGGNAFKTLRITMDYPNQRATFEQPLPGQEGVIAQRTASGVTPEKR